MLRTAVPDDATMRDESAIRDLIRRYNRSLDDRDVEGIVTLFDHDGVLHSMGQALVGRDAIRNMFSQVGGPLDRPLTAHHTTNTVIDLGSGVATAESDFLVLRRTGSGVEMMLAGRYRDSLALGPDGWKFTQRRIVTLKKSE